MIRGRRSTRSRDTARLTTVDAPAPPWILGARGSPLEAPENTLAGLGRALELGLDGFVVDARSTRDGEVVLLADDYLERTTDGRGLVREASWRDVAELDAGGSFAAAFRGERVPLLAEALNVSPPERDPGEPLVVIRVHEREDVPRVADLVREAARRRSVRIASRSRDACAEARDLGIASLWITDEVGERECELAREGAFEAVAAPARAWTAAQERGSLAWSCERWALDADDPEDLLSAARVPLFGLWTHEPARATCARVLARLAPQDTGAWPVQVGELEVVPGATSTLRGDWSGAWECRAHVRNAFPFACRVACGVAPRRGAFDIAGLPVAFELAPGAAHDVPFELVGGSWRPGGDPLFFARFSWRAGPGRPAGSVVLDAPLARVRRVRADASTQRLVLLRESPTDPPASMTMRRHGRHVYVRIENPGGLRDARALLHVAGVDVEGGRGVRAPLPPDFDVRPEGVAFSCGLVAWRDGERVVRRFAGGLPAELDDGRPGRLLPRARG